MIEQLITSFMAAAGFGVLFNAPKRSLIQGGIVGMLGWVLYFGMVEQGMDTVPATLAGASLVGLLSQICARQFKMPVIIFNVSGIIPLVPGGLAYDAMRNVVENDYNAAVQLAAKAFMISGSIAMGIVFSEVVNQIIKNSGKKQSF